MAKFPPQNPLSFTSVSQRGALLAFSLLVAFIVPIATPGALYADGDASAYNPRGAAGQVGADAAAADRGLPPVFPGEEVRDGDKTIKTWSTSGPVTVGQAPEPWRRGAGGAGNPGNGSGVGVWVDARRDRERAGEGAAGSAR